FLFPLRPPPVPDPNSPVVELLEPSDLLVHIGAKLVRHVAMSGLDDNIHVYLQRGVGVRTTRLGGHAPGVRHRRPTALRHRFRNDEGTHRTLISAQPQNPKPEIPPVRKRHTQTLIPTNGYFYGFE